MNNIWMLGLLGMSRAQHLQVRFLLVVYGNQNYVLYSPHDVRVPRCGCQRDVMLGGRDVRVQSYGCLHDVLQRHDVSHDQHYGFCLDLHLLDGWKSFLLRWHCGGQKMLVQVHEMHSMWHCGLTNKRVCLGYGHYGDHLQPDVLH